MADTLWSTRFIDKLQATKHYDPVHTGVTYVKNDQIPVHTIKVCCDW